ncbi:MAG: GNAT family N-acetyltransferase [Promethearchaeota archaeon]|nr:MAG: GNAT family N-acetyltransferase [Candidatus Lokiarchaeota archaeon]
MSNKYSVKTVDSFSDIVSYLQFGTQIPVRKDFHEFILSDFKIFQPISLHLRENRAIKGHCLLFQVDEILYFGFFNIQDHDPSKIEFLIERLQAYAQEHKCNTIIGPINIPTIIYGWGFMEKGSISSLFRAKPINPPIYLDKFKEYGFTLKTQEVSWEGQLPTNDQELLKNYDYQGFEVIDLTSWEELNAYTKSIIALNFRNLPQESLLTPKIEKVALNYVNFFVKFGELYMVSLLKDKKKDKIVGYISSLPNPFKAGSFSLYTLALDEEYRNKGLSWYLVNSIFEKGRAHGINYMSTPIEKSNIITQIMCEKAGLKLLRTHSIFKYII